jgi:DNA-binding beta-propeller fold protein YncE
MSRGIKGRKAGTDRGICRVALVAALTLLAGLVVWAAPALALSQRGYVFETSIGSSGSQAGQVSKPSGVAVNEATGDLYVVDRGNNRVEQFSAEGTFVRAWGYGVADGKKESEICTSGCKAGIVPGKSGPVTAKGQLDLPEGIAVDNSNQGASAGDVYVVADRRPEDSFVLKYTASGEFLGRVNKVEEAEDGFVAGVAVDNKGVVWIAFSENEIFAYTNTEPAKRVNKEEEIESELGDVLRSGLAVDSEDNLYVRHEPGEAFEEGEEEDGQGLNGQEPCDVSPCFAAKLTTKAVVAKGVERTPGEPLNEALDGENTSAVATNMANDDAYVGNYKSVATFTPEGTLIQRFGEAEAEGGLKDASGIAVDAKRGKAYVADAASDRIDVYVPEPPAAPAIDELSAEKITPTEAILDAQIQPKGAETTYRFQFSTATPVGCNAGPSCEAPIPPGDLGSEFNDVGANAHLTGLAPGTVYHYRVLATNSFGTATSVERTFTTQAVEGGFALPDGRAWELVSKPDKNGVAFESLSREGGSIQSAADGSGMAYIATGPDEPEPEGNRSPEFTQILSKRQAGLQGHHDPQPVRSRGLRGPAPRVSVLLQRSLPGDPESAGRKRRVGACPLRRSSRKDGLQTS